MRRFITAALLLLFVAQWSGAAFAATPNFGNIPSVVLSVFQPLQRSHYAVAPLARPDFTEARQPRVAPKPDLHQPHPVPVFHVGGTFDHPKMLEKIPASLPPDPLATDKGGQSRVHRSDVHVITATPTPAQTVPYWHSPVRVLKPLTAGATAGSGVTGAAPWWPFVSGGVPGVGSWSVNTATGNLMVNETDVDIPERGIDLSFAPVYNSMSTHDASNSDGSVPAIYGNGWTNIADAHMSYNAASNVMTVWDVDGARYDYTSNGAGGWVAPAGQHAILQFDGSCGYVWTDKGGTVFHFFSPTYSSCYGAQNAAYNGRLYMIYARNNNNWIRFDYSWSPDASIIAHLNQINMVHANGQTLILKFASFSGYTELASITRPDGVQITYQYDSAGDLAGVFEPVNNSNYGYHQIQYWSAQPHQLMNIVSPLYAQNGGAKGGVPTFWEDSSYRAITIASYAWANFTPDDGTNHPLQPALPQQFQVLDTISLSYPSAGETQLTDSNGRATNWFYDGAGRVSEEDDWTGAPENTWLRTYATWNANLNAPTETVDAAGNPTDYGYDGNGNVIWTQGPQVQTSQGAGRPVARFTYDQYNNLLSYCDPEYIWTTGATTCPSTGGTAHYSWTSDNGGDSTEPYGRLTDAYTARGYHRWFQYNTSSQGGGDYGLLTDAYGDCISQADNTSRCPHKTYAYNTLGDLTSYNTGAGTWALGYDGLNRPNTIVDPDGVTECAWYYQNGQISAHESPSEREAAVNNPSGSQCSALATPDTTAQQFTYDADGNEITETHHFNNVASTTTKWYDGLDRLVEVGLPSDPNDILGPWLTRYVYDITNSPNAEQYGNLENVQRYIPNETSQTGTTVSAAYAWVAVKAWNYDALDRVIDRLYFPPGATTMSTDRWAWDSRGAGLLASFSNAAGDSVTFSYDAVGNVTRRDYSSANTLYTGSLPSEEMTYDPNGRLHSLNNDETGMSLTTYDGDGNIASYTEPTGGTWSRPSALGTVNAISLGKSYNLSYYLDGTLSQLAQTDGNYTQQYNYRIDGLLESQRSSATWTYSGTTTGDDYGWNETFTPAGRVNYKSDTITDPYPQGTTTRHTMAYCGTASGCSLSAALTVGYDNYGRIKTWAIPEGAYSSFQYDAEGEPTSFTAGSQPWTLGYSTRGELLTQGPSLSNPAAAYRSADGFLYPTSQVCWTNRYDADVCGVPTQGFDPRNGAMVSTQRPCTACAAAIFTTLNVTYDLAGRRNNREYDVANRLYFASTYETYAQGDGTIPPASHFDTNHAVLGTTPTGSTQNGVVTDVKFGMNSDILPNNSSFTGLTVYDRDPFGFVAASRQDSAYSDWTIPNMFNPCGSLAQVTTATASFVATPMTSCNPGGRLYAYRTDGYYDGAVTMRGVRTYDGDTQQWSTPDMYQGAMDDPMSGLGYNYANNNPAVFADPSGFCGSAWDSNGPGGAQSTPTTHNTGLSNCPDVAFDNCVEGCYGPGGNLLTWGDDGRNRNHRPGCADGGLPADVRPPTNGFTPEYAFAAQHGGNLLALWNSTTGSGTFNYNQYSKPQFRGTANFGLGVYAAGSGIGMGYIFKAIDQIGALHHLSADQIYQDKEWAAEGGNWASSHCHGGYSDSLS